LCELGEVSLTAALGIGGHEAERSTDRLVLLRPVPARGGGQRSFGRIHSAPPSHRAAISRSTSALRRAQRRRDAVMTGWMEVSVASAGTVRAENAGRLPPGCATRAQKW